MSTQPMWKRRKRRYSKCAECKQKYVSWRMMQIDGKDICYPSCWTNEQYALRLSPYDVSAKSSRWALPTESGNDFSG